jgi:hypothetical protein
MSYRAMILCSLKVHIWFPDTTYSNPVVTREAHHHWINSGNTSLRTVLPELKNVSGSQGSYSVMKGG